MKLAPGLHRIGNDLIAAYLVVEDDGVTIIDAALSGHHRELVRELRAIGRTIDDVRGIVLTHGDTDHIGFAARLQREAGVPVFVHEADAARARGEENTHPAWGQMRVGATLGFLAYSARRGGLRTTYLDQVTTFHAGDALDLPGTPLIVGMPGHSPGSIAVSVPAVDALFVGDALTTRHVLTGARGVQPAPFTDDPAQAAASIERLRAIDARWVLPGHGGPWTGGVPELIAAYRAAMS